MNMWLTAATVLLVGMVPLGIVCVRAEPIDGLIALVTAATTLSFVLLLLAVGFGRSTYTDLALVLSVLSFSGGLVFVRYLERWT
jgi:multisubunit Na+/H+ antiporter MnhF subunit